MTELKELEEEFSYQVPPPTFHTQKLSLFVSFAHAPVPRSPRAFCSCFSPKKMSTLTAKGKPRGYNQ